MYRMSKSYEKAYKGMLTGVAGLSRKSPPLTALWPISGKRYIPGSGLLLVGRATNGWCGKWPLLHLRTAEGRKEIAATARDNSEDDEHCPMSWVYKYASKSAFWRVTRRVVLALHKDLGEDSSWASHMAWTNLYKVAPHRRGNPDDDLCEAQYEGCVKLLGLELEELRPAHVLVIAGKDWYEDFIRDLNIAATTYEGRFVEVTARHCGSDLVFTKRPERKPEAPFVREVLAALTDLSGGD